MLGISKKDVLALPMDEFFDYSVLVELRQKQEFEFMKAGIMKGRGL